MESIARAGQGAASASSASNDSCATFSGIDAKLPASLSVTTRKRMPGADCCTSSAKPGEVIAQTL